MAKKGEMSHEPKQIRARARRRRHLEAEEMAILYKPIEEWDAEELARGRPRGKDGKFHGPAARWMSRTIHEEAIRRFTELSQADMRAIVPQALDTVRYILECDDTNDKGRPVVPPSVKLDAAKWVVEHLVGKPTQRVEADISVRLQAILGSALVIPEKAENPDDPDLDPKYRAAIDVASWVDEEEEDDGEED